MGLRRLRQGGLRHGRRHQDRENTDRSRGPVPQRRAKAAGRDRVRHGGGREEKVVSALFISDLHLTEERPAANERFIDFLEGEARAASALYILGDFFEYWIGDDDLEEPFNAVMAGLLRGLTRGGVALYFMHGNRDFLIGERFCAATGAELLADPTVHEIEGARTLLAHGDTLCTDDADYQNWPSIARSAQSQREYLANSR